MGCIYTSLTPSAGYEEFRSTLRLRESQLLRRNNAPCAGDGTLQVSPLIPCSILLLVRQSAHDGIVHLVSPHSASSCTRLCHIAPRRSCRISAWRIKSSALYWSSGPRVFFHRCSVARTSW